MAKIILWFSNSNHKWAKRIIFDNYSTSHVNLSNAQMNLTSEGPCIIFCNIYTFQRDTQCSSTDCLLMRRCQLYMFRTVTVHPQELLFRYCMCRLWYAVRTALSDTSGWYNVWGRMSSSMSSLKNVDFPAKTWICCLYFLFFNSISTNFVLLISFEYWYYCRSQLQQTYLHEFLRREQSNVSSLVIFEKVLLTTGNTRVGILILATPR